MPTRAAGFKPDALHDFINRFKPSQPGVIPLALKGARYRAEPRNACCRVTC
ncbi:hypothetical protein LMG29739_01337 [Paraburkholderia solisilvae]|uniref:Uncharacterized protein n=1 Tax=Paraburkholderia solisilvae TaxID=624376 RepID=A0A6J5DDV4_9BURK|nr:hypothetical protein LMG29739_01337 [Paraburkholderia solisilvae]